MTSIFEATEPTKKNLDSLRGPFEQRPDADLIGMTTSQPDTAKGVMSAILLAERKAAKENTEAELATKRHTALLAQMKKPHWSITPGFLLLAIGTVAACVAAYPVLFGPPANSSAVPSGSAALAAPLVPTSPASSPLLSASSPAVPSSKPRM